MCVCLSRELGMMKRLLSTRWAPHLLTLDQKRVRMQLSKECLERFKKNATDFMRRFVTTDETWVYYYTKFQSNQNSASKKANKVMASVFWDAKGILMIDYLPRGQTINGEYYANLLDQLQQNIQRKRPDLSPNNIIFHHDNARAHTCVTAMAKIIELKYDLLPHPPYSPDLAPSDFHLFPKLKMFLAGQRFTSDKEVKSAVDAYFADLEESTFLDGIKALEHRWTKCIERSGDYVGK